MDQQKAIKLEIVSQPKQVEQPTRNWLDLPSELTANILSRIGVIAILRKAQKVCTAWRKICKDPAMWRVIYMDARLDPNGRFPLDEMVKRAVNRSKGQLVDITIVDFRYNDILLYAAKRCSQLKRLTMAHCEDYMHDFWTKALQKFPLLEELSLYETDISENGIEAAGRYCSMLKTLKVNQEDYIFRDEFSDGEIDVEDIIDNGIAMAIGQNLHELRHLEVIGNTMSNEGLKMILDGCHHLESLDLRRCLFIDLDGDLGKRCLKQIKCVKLPDDSLEGCPYIYQNDDMTRDFYAEYEGESDDESEEGFYDDSEEGSYDESEGEFDDESEEASDDE